MTPDLEHFLDLATRPLEAEPGMREEAKGELMARVGHAGVPYEMLDLRPPVERLEANPPRNPWPRRAALLATVVVSLVTVTTSVSLQSREFTLMTTASMMSFTSRMGGGTFANENPLLADYVRNHAPNLPLGTVVLQGGESETEPGLWLAQHPDDLAMFQEQVSRRLRITTAWTGLSDPEKDVISRLDPGNALWPLMQVVPHVKTANGGSSYRGGAASPMKPPSKAPSGSFPKRPRSPRTPTARYP